MKKVVAGAFMFLVPSGLLYVVGIRYVMKIEPLFEIKYCSDRRPNYILLIYCSKTLSCYALYIHPPCCPVKIQVPKKGARKVKVEMAKTMVPVLTL